MNCSFCGPQVQIEKGQGCCPICLNDVYNIYYYSKSLILSKVMQDKGVSDKIDETGVALHRWSREHAAELYREMKIAEGEMHKMFEEGVKAVAGQRFNAKHFKAFKKVFGGYGNKENKLFTPYVKADIEVSAAFISKWEQKPVQAGLSL